MIRKTAVCLPDFFSTSLSGRSGRDLYTGFIYLPGNFRHCLKPEKTILQKQQVKRMIKHT
jgi:hypothetical protein